jgi:hypothetical protein
VERVEAIELYSDSLLIHDLGHRVDGSGFLHLDYRSSNSLDNEWSLDGVWWNAYTSQKPGLLPVYAYANDNFLNFIN